jgi:hypothetical protein
MVDGNKNEIHAPPEVAPGGVALANWQLFNQLCAFLAKKGMMTIDEYTELFVGAAESAKKYNKNDYAEIKMALEAMNPRVSGRLPDARND